MSVHGAFAPIVEAAGGPPAMASQGAGGAAPAAGAAGSSSYASLPSSSQAGPSSSSSSSVWDLPLSKRVVSLCLWHSPSVSGLTLLSLCLITFLLQRGYTALTLVSYVLALQLLTVFVFINASRVVLKLKGQTDAAAGAAAAAAAAVAKTRARSPHASSSGAASSGIGAAGDASDPSPEFVSEATLRALVPVVHSTLNVLLGASLGLIRCTSNTATLQAIVVLLALSVVGRMADGVTTVALAGIAALTLPKLYQMHQTTVDRALGKARDAVDRAALALGVKSAKQRA